ncbi:MAG: hypothetical protein IPN69_11765 [Acidobacteria bacterium]|nr:hypothetical protein [Acidobacteriota bacterium]
MNLFDLTIIYLACGAPFGVYFFLTSKERLHKPSFYIGLSLNFLFWIQYAVRLTLASERVRKLFDSDSKRGVGLNSRLDHKIQMIRARCEEDLHRISPNFRIFEFRDEFERMVGLNLELNGATRRPAAHVNELCEISGRGRSAPAEACLHRRNLAKLVFHRDVSRRELLSRFELLIKGDAMTPDLRADIAELFLIVGDSSAASEFERRCVFAEDASKKRLASARNDVRYDRAA